MPARNPADVMAAWNASCQQFNFSTVGSITPPGTTVADMYNGADVNKDLTALYRAMQAQLQSTNSPGTDPEELLTAVWVEPAWYS
jgi:hypothetical protein